MSLIKRPAMTERKLAANRENQKLSRGPITEEGRERIRAAQLRHGFYSQAEEVAMRALGEDPAQFQELLEALWEEWKPVGGLQEEPVIRLARAIWLMNRADRMQEGYAVRQARDVSVGRDDRRHAQLMRLKIIEDRLRRLALSVGREDYVTTPQDLEKLKNLHQEGAMKEMGEFALTLYCELQPPGTGADGVDPQEKSRRALISFKAIFGLDSDHPPGVMVAPSFPPPAGSPPSVGAPLPGPPVQSTVRCDPNPRTPEIKAADATQAQKHEPETLSPAEEARERARQLLENILTRQAESCAGQRKALREEFRRGPSPYERAAEIAPTHPNARVMRRMQDSNFREVRRVTNLLLKLKRHERQVADLAGSEGNGRRLPRYARKQRGLR